MAMSDQLSARIARQIVTIRTARGMSQIKLARHLGLKARTGVSKWENGQATPGIEILQRLAEALDVPLAQFLEPITYKGQNLALDPLLGAIAFFLPQLTEDQRGKLLVRARVLEDQRVERGLPDAAPLKRTRNAA